MCSINAAVREIAQATRSALARIGLMRLLIYPFHTQYSTKENSHFSPQIHSDKQFSQLVQSVAEHKLIEKDTQTFQMMY